MDQLLAAGHTVVTTVRSEDKAARLRDAHADKGDRLSVAVVGDIAVEGAFDKVVEGTPGLEVVMHTASPFHFKWSKFCLPFLFPRSLSWSCSPTR